MAQRRVRVVVSVGEGQVEQERLRTAVERRGWHLGDRLSADAEPDRVSQVNRVTRIIDVVLAGSEFMARRAALREVTRLGEVQAIDVTVRSAELVPSPATPHLYRVYRVPGGDRWRWLRGLLVPLGPYDTGRSIALAEDESVTEAEHRLSDSGSEGRVALRPHGLWRGRPSQFDPDERRRVRLAVLGVLVGTAALALGSAALAVEPRGIVWTRLVCAVLSMAGLLTLLLGIIATPALSPTRKAAYLLVLLCHAAAFTWIFAAYGSLTLLFMVVAVPVAFFGLRLLLSGVSGGVLASWAVPLLVTVGLAGLPGVSGLYHRVYFSRFGIDDTSSIPISEPGECGPPWSRSSADG